MKKIVLAALLLAATNVKAQSIADKLPGNWTVTHIAFDANGNNQLDKDEQEGVAALGFTFSLNADGSGMGRMDMLATSDNRFSWTTGNNGTEITFNGQGNGDKKFAFLRLADGSSTMHVDKLSGNNLQLSSNDGGKMWMVLKRK